MLVGIQGSGKSEIAKQLEQKGYFVASNDRYCTVKEGNFVLEYNFVQKKFFCANYCSLIYHRGG